MGVAPLSIAELHEQVEPWLERVKRLAIVVYHVATLLDSALETEAIRDEPEALEAIRRARRDLRAGRVRPAEAVFPELRGSGRRRRVAAN